MKESNGIYRVRKVTFFVSVLIAAIMQITTADELSNDDLNTVTAGYASISMSTFSSSEGTNSVAVAYAGTGINEQSGNNQLVGYVRGSACCGDSMTSISGFSNINGYYLISYSPSDANQNGVASYSSSWNGLYPVINGRFHNTMSYGGQSD